MPKGDTDVRYKGYLIRWTGWKQSQSSLCMVGQWFMEGRNSQIIYSGTNGAVGVIKKSGQMDLSVKGEEGLLTPMSSAADREMKKQEALAKIIEIIDTHDGNFPEDKVLPERSL